ncbi:MAG: LysR family transcriptional regulator [Epulopiscium sp.]|nr:LysR family transcriptional regulator [Candidatus Epulonipiscium sp.]
MNLEYLESFYMTVKHNSMSKAASELHISQPGLSGQIKSLENELGVKLLNRSNKGVELTEEGTVVFNYADTLLSIQGNIKRDLTNLNEDIPKLVIGACKSVGEYALPCSLFTFKDVHSEVDISMDVVNSAKVVDSLQDHTINIGIIQHYKKNDDLDIKPIVSDELLLVGDKNLSPEKITLDELQTLPLIIREEGSGTRDVMEKALASKGLDIKELNIVYDLNSPEAIKSSITSGKGFSFLPRIVVANELKNSSLKVISIEDFNVSFSYYLASRSNYSLAHYEQNFVDFIASSRRGFC